MPTTPTPGRDLGYTPAQREAMRRVEEQALLDLIRETVDKLNRVGDRLDAYASQGENRGRASTE